MTRRLIVLALTVLALAGCVNEMARPSSQSSSSSTASPQVRCLNDPNEGSTRPLFFLFCVQSP